MPQIRRIMTALLTLGFGVVGTGGDLFKLANAAKVKAKDQPGNKAVEGGPWGEAVDGLACRLVLRSRYVIGQGLSAVVEVKNTSNKKRYIVPQIEFEVTGPKGELEQAHRPTASRSGKQSYELIEPDEVKRWEVADLGEYFRNLNGWLPLLKPKDFPAPTGNYTALVRFSSPEAPPRLLVSWTVDKGYQYVANRDFSPEITAGQWANEVISPKVSFKLTALAKDDLVVHEWGVFTVFNDVKFANVNRKEEWGSLPSFFYRQFPKERLRWDPSVWDKPIVYFYAKNTPMRVNVKVTFAEGAPVVWWPAAAEPVDDWPGGLSAKRPTPFRSLTWRAWLGDQFPAELSKQFPFHGKKLPDKVSDFPLPKDCWLQDARLPSATQVTVIGNIDTPPKIVFPGSKDRVETERFLYYDGLVPAPDYLRCEKIDGKSVTLRNRARFDITRLFVVDHRAQRTVGFAFVNGKTPAFKAGTSLKIELRPIHPEDWPFTGMKQARQALLDAGLFEAEVDALLKIWDKRLLQAKGVTAFHILPLAEYDRMLPIEIQPAPAITPVRVGIAVHPHIEIEPMLTQHIGALIRQLDSPSFDKRLAADKELRELGPLAIAMLRAELKKEVPLETSRRIEAVLERVDAASWLNFPPPAKKPEKQSAP